MPYAYRAGAQYLPSTLTPFLTVAANHDPFGMVPPYTAPALGGASHPQYSTALFLPSPNAAVPNGVTPSILTTPTPAVPACSPIPPYAFPTHQILTSADICSSYQLGVSTDMPRHPLTAEHLRSVSYQQSAARLRALPWGPVGRPFAAQLLADARQADEARNRVLKTYHELGRELYMRRQHKWRQTLASAIPAPDTFLHTTRTLGFTHPQVRSLCIQVDADTDLRRRQCGLLRMTPYKRAHLDFLARLFVLPSKRTRSRFEHFFRSRVQRRREVGESEAVIGPWNDGRPPVHGAMSAYAAIRKVVAESNLCAR